jgi:hypothetical protein
MSLSRKAAGAALVAAIGAGAILFNGGVVHGQAQPPTARIFGAITVNGQNAPSGAIVTAYGNNNTLCGTSTGQGVYNGTQYYVDIDSANPACNQAGITLTFKVNGAAATTTTTVPSTPGSAVQLDLTVSGSGTSTGSVTYQPGWNMIAGPAGMVFSQAQNPLYTIQLGTNQYTTQPNTQAVSAGAGYWAYFSSPTTVSLSGTSSTATTVTLAAGTYAFVGNSSTTATVTVSGADACFKYDPTSNSYSIVTTLGPGQACAAFSTNGATVTVQ